MILTEGILDQRRIDNTVKYPWWSIVIDVWQGPKDVLLMKCSSALKIQNKYVKYESYFTRSIF